MPCKLTLLEHPIMKKLFPQSIALIVPTTQHTTGKPWTPVRQAELIPIIEEKSSAHPPKALAIAHDDSRSESMDGLTVEGTLSSTLRTLLL